MAKEILIDGVDVNKCEQHSDLEYISNNNGYEEVPNNCGVYADRICENHSNCYYKQLIRKEQELQQLKVESEKLKVDYAEMEGEKPFQIVLTIAHLDHNPQNNNPDNLRALCQKCHNNYDKEHRKQTRAKTLEQKKGQLK